jgi:uncharacterized protein YraI
MIPGFTAEASLYKTSECYQLRDVYEGSISNSSTALYLSQGVQATYRGCYQLYSDCDIAGLRGILSGYWTAYWCHCSPSNSLCRYCALYA